MLISLIIRMTELSVFHGAFSLSFPLIVFCFCPHFFCFFFCYCFFWSISSSDILIILSFFCLYLLLFSFLVHFFALSLYLFFSLSLIHSPYRLVPLIEQQPLTRLTLQSLNNNLIPSIPPSVSLCRPPSSFDHFISTSHSWGSDHTRGCNDSTFIN